MILAKYEQSAISNKDTIWILCCITFSPGTVSVFTHFPIKNNYHLSKSNSINGHFHSVRWFCQCCKNVCANCNAHFAETKYKADLLKYFRTCSTFHYYYHVPKLNCWLKFSTTHHFASHSNVHYLMPSEQNSECHRTNYTWDWTLMVSGVHHQELETTSQFTCQVIKYLYLERKKTKPIEKKIFCLT